jgi:predicted transcriptional regulator
LSALEKKIANALAASHEAIGLIGLMVDADTAYSSASVTARALIRKGLAERSLGDTGIVYRLTPAGKAAQVASL